VFILCDNVGWGDSSCYGESVPTPRIDNPASKGIRFNNDTVRPVMRGCVENVEVKVREAGKNALEAELA